MRYSSIIATSALVVALLLSTGQSAKAVLVILDFQDDVNVMGGVNKGGLDNSLTSFANSNDALKFSLTIDDTTGIGNSGTKFTTILQISGALTNGTGNVFVDSDGRISFASGATLQDTLSFSFGSITQTFGPSATANFDGFKSVALSGWTASSDGFTFGGSTYIGNANSSPITFSPLVAASSVFDRTGSNGFQLATLTSQFSVTVSAIPEASQIAAFGLIVCALGLVHLKRRKNA